MLSPIAKFLLVLTSLAPILLTLTFSAALESEWWFSASYFGGFFVLIGLSLLVLRKAAKTLEVFPIEVQSLKTVDREVVGFTIAYLLPLLTRTPTSGIDPWLAGFLLAIFFAVVWGTHSYHFNPVLGMMGYHFYEITTAGNITYVLITRQDIRSTKGVTQVVQVGEYMVLDAGAGH